MFIILLIFISQKQPLFERPIEPDRDLLLLEEQIQKGLFIPQEWVDKIVIYTMTGELAEADQLISKLHEQAPENPIFLEAKMYSLWQNHQDIQGAATLGSSILERFPTHQTLRVNLARVYFANNDLPRAMNLLLDQLELLNLSQRDWQLLFQILGKTGDPNGFMNQIADKMKANPDSSALKKVYFILLVRFAYYEMAVQFLDQHPDLKADQEIKRFHESIKEFK